MTRIFRLKLTEDEIRLLYYLVLLKQEGQKFLAPETNYAYNTVLEWIDFYRKQAPKQTIESMEDLDVEKLTSTEEFAEQQKIPEIVREILKIAYDHGVDIIRSAFKSITGADVMSLQNLQMFVTGLGIMYD